MGKTKRHFKGAKRGEDKRARAEKADDWKNTRGGDPSRKSWSEMNMSNDKFEAFYKAQGFINLDGGEDKEWNSFLNHLREPLPACFRINEGYAFSDTLAKELHEYAGTDITGDKGLVVKGVEQMGWYPGGFAYKLGTDRRNIRKMDSLKGLHEWMVKNTDNGNITRQEAVSMVPPLALDVKPHHRCLDMCAAPGSKTSQLLEICSKSVADAVKDNGNEKHLGLVVANDSDTDRAYMLAHQCRRINSPLLIITTHKGQMFPKFRNLDSQSTPETPLADYYLKDGFFDRVLADVPCSGDGTMRKNPAIWNKWNTSGSISLHALQITIANRGIQLLKEDGLIVYSTCSMSPYEDEATVAELLRQNKGKLELVDARQFLPDFKCRSGMSDWIVLDDVNASRRKQKQKEFHAKRHVEYAEKAEKAEKEEKEEKEASATATIDIAAGGEEKKVENEKKEEKEGEPASAPQTEAEIAALFKKGVLKHENPYVQAAIDMGMEYYPTFEDVDPTDRNRLRASIFPPTAEEKGWMHLEKCMRCVPHDEDTGGFFVATLRKVPQPEEEKKAEEKVEKAATAATAAEVEEGEHSAKRAKGGEDGESAVTTSTSGKQRGENNNGNGRDPRGIVDFAKWDDAAYAKVAEFYGLTGPAVQGKAFFTRVDSTQIQPEKKTEGPKSVYYFPQPMQDAIEACQMKVVSAGTKVFERRKETNKKGKDDGTKEPKPEGYQEYRLLQDGVHALIPYMTKRKVELTIQDFCNLLDGGLVSFTTLSPETCQKLESQGAGAIVCVYKWNASDMLEGSKEASVNVNYDYIQPLCVMASFGKGKSLNVLCGKTDAESIKHQLESMKVYRPKIVSSLNENSNSSSSKAGAATAAVAEEEKKKEEEEKKKKKEEEEEKKEEEA